MGIRVDDIVFKSGSERLSGRMFAPAAPDREPGPAIILVHGLGSEGSTMDGCAKALAGRGITTMEFDQRGHGKSSGVYDGDSSNDVLAAAQYLRDQATVDGERIGVVGHSSGARDAIIACTKDSRLEPLVCTSTPADNPADGSHGLSFIERTGVFGSQRNRSDFSRYPQDGPLPWLNGWALQTFSRSWGWIRGYRLRVDWRATFEAWSRARPSIAITEMDARPTLFVHSENDRTAPVEGAEIVFMKANGPKEFFVRRGGYHSTPVRKGPLRSAWTDWIGEQMMPSRRHI
jgi:pimeloyl-ACP methyl ester carboxylesterase